MAGDARVEPIGGVGNCKGDYVCDRVRWDGHQLSLQGSVVQARSDGRSEERKA